MLYLLLTVVVCELVEYFGGLDRSITACLPASDDILDAFDFSFSTKTLSAFSAFSASSLSSAQIT